MKKTLLVFHPTYLKHSPGSPEPGVIGYHPENAERLRRVISFLQQQSDLNIDWHEPKPVPMSLLEKIHNPFYIAHIESYSKGVPLDYRVVNADTPINEFTYEAALLTAGGAVDAVDFVLDKKFENALVLSRPGGHHAESDRGMGFCIFNTIAAGAKRAQERGLERIAIVDWDVHHGNGTQQIFYKDPGVLYISLHQECLFPRNTGHSSEQGLDTGIGYTRNFPLPAGTVSGTYLNVFDHEVLSILERFRPELILIDAGFDAHWEDPIGSLRLKEDVFIHMTRRLKEVAEKHCLGRIVSSLAGGYNIHTLPRLVYEHVRELNK